MNSMRPFLLAVAFCATAYSQNDLDALRLSRTGVGGSSRFIAMGGAFGALGADLSCAAYNPGGLGLYRTGEISFSGGLKITNNEAVLHGNKANELNATLTFNNFGIASVWPAEKDPDSRHIIGFTSSQLQNFFNVTRISANTNVSIAGDMLNRAQQSGSIARLNPSYDGMAYNTYVLDFDSVENKFFSFVDLKRNLKQNRDLINEGKINDVNLSYAYALQDKYYLGLSLGLPQVEYSSTMIHHESDSNDSMRITLTSPDTYTSTYSSDLPFIYTDRLGFNSLTYTEFFKTTGSGLNLKLGAVIRLNDEVRLGLYYHTPTLYRLTDEYFNTMEASFDKNPKSPEKDKFPENEGNFKYQIITPSRLGLNAAFIIQKAGLIAIDHELIDYRQARIFSNDAFTFSDANEAIKRKYHIGHNVRIGGELNLNPIMLRLGYSMQGSPFGHVLFGDFVRHGISAGLGFRTKSHLYFDLVWSRNFTSENYYLFSTLNSKAKLNFNNSNFAATVGIKF
jgi:hypothetical protein